MLVGFSHLVLEHFYPASQLLYLMVFLPQETRPPREAMCPLTEQISLALKLLFYDSHSLFAPLQGF